MPDPPTTDRDRDCAALARAALFPLQINRDGTHPTIFPALEALGKVRDDAAEANPDRAPSSFFPSRVVVVRAVGGSVDALQWNGQPDIRERDASFEVIPRMLSVRCMECAGMQHPCLTAFTRQIELQSYERGNDKGDKHREVVICTDRALKKDYSHDKIMDLPPQSFAAVEEALAREVTKVRDQLKSDRGEAAIDPKTVEGVAASEIRAARAAECYHSKHGKEVKRGSHMPLGYSLLPGSLQRWARDRCIRSTAAKATGKEFGAEEGRRCVAEIFEEIMRDV